MKTIAENWASYEAEAIRVGADARLRKVMRHAFYAGTVATFIALDKLDSEAGTDDEACALVMDRLRDECARFALEVAPIKAGGRA